jgi:2-desacetyl-2-hydroxyethyl bacteriochlorophyllide A dehydrogenase
VQSLRLSSPRIGELVVEQYEVPDVPPAGGILVAAHVTIVSAGTEIANYLGRTTERPPERVTPYHPGYSFAGEVLAAGEAVERFRPGDRIAGPIGHAAHAIEDRPERLARFTHIPDGVSDREAALSQLSCIALNGVRKAGIALGESVVVVGTGLVGLLAGRLAQLNGALPLIGLELIPERRDAAKRFGMDLVLDPAAERTPTVIDSLERGGADVVIEATGSPGAFVPALAMTRPGGRVVLLGSTRGEVEGFSPYHAVHRKGLTIVGAHVSTVPVVGTPYDPWTEAANRRVVLSLMQRKRLQVEPLISHTIVPAQAGEAFARLASAPEKHLGIAIDWTRA